MTENGFILLHRKILKHWIFKDPFYFHWFVYFLLRANHTKSELLIGAELYQIERGQFITSIQNLTKELPGATTQKIRTFLNLLEKQQMITKKSTSKLTQITICNYGSYQGDQQTNNKRITNQQQTNNKRITTDNNNKQENKNVNKKKTNKNPVVLDIIDFCKPYFNEKYLKLNGTLDVIDKLIRIDKYEPATIKQAIINAIKHDFWSKQFHSPAKLRNKNKDQVYYIDVFLSLNNQKTNDQIYEAYRKARNYKN